MSQDSILVIEDEPDILELIRYNLKREGFEVITASRGEAGFREALRRRPSLIVLDLMLPDLQGLEVCRMLRNRTETQHTPIIMLTAKSEESDIILGLELGADDYLTKPFSIKELLARARAVLRRSNRVREIYTQQPIRAGPLLIDPERHEVLLDGQLVPLTLTEFRLLAGLASNRGKVMTRDQLLDHVTGGEASIIDRNIDVHIRSIRKKLAQRGDLIVTVRGVGYKLADDRQPE